MPEGGRKTNLIKKNADQILSSLRERANFDHLANPSIEERLPTIQLQSAPRKGVVGQSK